VAYSTIKQGKIASVFALLSVLIAFAPSAYSQSAAENIRPVAKVCMAGQPCVGSKADVGMASGSTTMAAAVVEAVVEEAVEEAVEEVIEVVQEQAAVVAAASTGFDAAAKYQMSCFACHGTGAAGAPKLDDKAAWETRMAKGMDAVMVNVMNGINAMPPKGLCFDCSDSDLFALVEYMVSQ
jgi:cytochrome c5